MADEETTGTRSRQTARASAAKPRKPRRLRACLITLLVLVIILAVAWFFISRNLGLLIGDYVRQEASESLNGRLEFASLEIDLMGRAVLTDVAVYSEEAEQPEISCPEVIVGFDLINLIGPNRGRRSIAVALDKPQLHLVRAADGSFNLAKLARQRDKESEQQYGVSFRLNDASIDFKDLCLLNQSYPRIPEQTGLVAELLTELGYTPEGPPWLFPREETLRLNGGAEINTERGELTLDLEATRDEPGGWISAKGRVKLDGTEYTLRLQGKGVELNSAREYLIAAFPELVVVGSDAESTAATGQPQLAGLIERADLKLITKPGEEVSFEGDVILTDLSFTSQALPALRFERYEGDYDSAKQLLKSELDLSVFSAKLTGKPQLNFTERTLKGRLAVEGANAGQVLALLTDRQIKSTGEISARLELSGTFDSPGIEADVSSESLTLAGLALGKLSGKASYSDDQLALSKLKLAGGKVPLSADGKINLVSEQGTVEAQLTGVEAQDLLSLLGALSGNSEPVELDANGKLNATASLGFKAGNWDAILSLSSERLLLGGYELSRLKGSGRVTPPNIKLHEVICTLNTGREVSLAGLESSGNLSFNVRVGGSVSMLPGEPVVLGLVGEAASTNLSPDQANVSFKVIGPASDPELRFGLKTDALENPLSILAQTHYRNGFAPLNAELYWFDSSANFEGEVDFSQEKIKGELSASKLDLGLLSDSGNLSGLASATATVGGTFSAPSITGSINLPRLGYAVGQRTYLVSDGTAEFALVDGERLNIERGGFSFEGNAFMLAGSLGGGSGDLTASCSNFNLFSALAVAPLRSAEAGAKSTADKLPLDINSSGPLKIHLTGELQDPTAGITYTSGAGSVEGHSFSGASLSATASLAGVSLDSFSITSPGGSIAATGSYAVDPYMYSLQADIEQFNVGIVTPLTGTELWASLEGVLSGEAGITGDERGYSLAGELELLNGSYEDVPITAAHARVGTNGRIIELSQASITAQGTTLTAQGTIGPEPHDLNLTAKAASLNLDLLGPWLPEGAPELQGYVALEAATSPGQGELPELDIKLNDTGQGVVVDSSRIDSVNASFKLSDTELDIRKCILGVGASSLELSGSVGLKVDPETREVPLALRLETQNFALNTVGNLIPEQYKQYKEFLPGGTLNGEVDLRGTSGNPQLTGDLKFELRQLPGFMPSMVSGINGHTTITRNDFDIKQLDLLVSTGRDTEALTRVPVTGSGTFRLNPLSLTSGQVDIALAPGGRFTEVTYPSASGQEDDIEIPMLKTLSGFLGGTVNIKPAAEFQPGDAVAVISGLVMLNQEGESSSLTFAIPSGGEDTGGTAAPVTFQGLTVRVAAGTTARLDSPRIMASVYGDLTVNGRPGVAEGAPDELTVDGELSISDGTMFLPYIGKSIYLGAKSLDKLRFDSSDPNSAGAQRFVPLINGTGMVILPRVLPEGGTVTTGSGEIQSGMQRGARDLEVYFSFADYRINPDMGIIEQLLKGSDEQRLTQEITLSSAPPFAQDVILNYLLEGVIGADLANVLRGEGELSAVDQSTLIGFGSGFISHAVEGALGLDSFQFGGVGDDDNPFYIDIEKSVSPEVSLTYFRNFYSEINQSEEIGIRYSILPDRWHNEYQNVDLILNFQLEGPGTVRGPGAEFMFQWTTKF